MPLELVEHLKLLVPLELAVNSVLAGLCLVVNLLLAESMALPAGCFCPFY